MFKRITAAVVCLVLIAASFASCAVKGPKTYREAVAAGREFAESDGLKDITVSAESDGVKLTFTGKYDRSVRLGVFTVSVEKEDTINTFKDLIKYNGDTVYVKIPDMSGMGAVLPFAIPDPGMDEFPEDFDIGTFELPEDFDIGTFELPEDFDPSDLPEMPDFSALLDLDDAELEQYGITREMLDQIRPYIGEDGQIDFEGLLSGLDLSGFGLTSGDGENRPVQDLPESPVGKYIAVKIPEHRETKLGQIIKERTEAQYEKMLEIEPEEQFPFVVRTTGEDVKALIVDILDSIRNNEAELIDEAVAAIKEQLGKENAEKLEAHSGEKLENTLKKEMDAFFEDFSADDIKSGDGALECVQKAAYETGKRFEQRSEITFDDEGEKKTVKIAVTITAAKADESFADRCTVAESDVLDPSKYMPDQIPEDTFGFAA